MPDLTFLPPSVTRILETSLYVRSLATSRSFYGKLFSFPILLEDERMCAMAIPGKQVLLLFRRAGSVRPAVTPFGLIPPHGGVGTLHLCFSIGREDLERWRDHLTACGVQIESRLDWPKGGSSLYFRDPDHHSIELATSGLWQNDPIIAPA
jgi:catechol 2,3-dioxygenase-like lactoylglutathione lyase family enzyme